MTTKAPRLFGELLRKFRLRAELETLPQLGEALAEKGLVFEDSTLSRWQTGSRIPARRKILLTLIEIFAENKGIQFLSEANQLMEAAGQGYLTEKEITNLPAHLVKQIPYQPPRITEYFVGREKELEKIEKIIKKEKSPVIAIYGLAGVGKTVLAIRVAQLFQHLFPDGVLWSRLDVTSSMSILAKIARAYGEDITPVKDLASRSEIVRSILSQKKALMIFDNAQSSQQLRPLLPGITDSVVIATSRNSNLEALSAATKINLLPFDIKEGLSLFQERLGDQWLTNNQEEAKQLAQLVGYLPLALNICIDKIVTSRVSSIQEIIQEIEKETVRLMALVHEDVSVRTSFELSYSSLSKELQTLFGSLGVFGGADFSLEAVAVILNWNKRRARKELNQLINRSLVEYSTTDRYRLHPLMKLFAKEKMKNKSFYIKAAHYFSNLLDRVVGEEQYSNYTIVERDLENILSLCNWCAKSKETNHLIKFLGNISNFLFEYGLWDELEILNTYLPESGSLKYLETKTKFHLEVLSWMHFWKGNLEQVKKLAEKGLIYGKELNNQYLMGLAKSRLGYIAYHKKNYNQAENLLNSALQIFRAINDKTQVAKTLLYLAHVPYKQGCPHKAEIYLNQALSIAKAINSKRIQCEVLTNLGNVMRLQRKYKKARIYILKSHEFEEEMRRQDGCYAWNNYRLSLLERDLGNFEQAHELLLKSQKEFKQLGMRKVFAETQKVLEQIEKHKKGELGLSW